MFKKPQHDINADGTGHLLGKAILSIPDPEISNDFNDRIHSALYRKATPRRSWYNLRPTLSAMCGSFVITLALLSLAGRSMHLSSSPDATGADLHTAAQSAGMNDMDNLIERADLKSATIRSLRSPMPNRTPSNDGPDPNGVPSSRIEPTVRRLQGA